MPPVHPTSLDPVLVLAPDLPFASLARTVEALGWTGGPVPSVLAPLLPGEPEAARWSRAGRHPTIHYSFDPVSRLRTLDLDLATPAHRAALAARLPALGLPELGALLTGAPRDALRGIGGLRALADPRALPLLAPLRQDPVPAVRAAAEAAEDALRAEAEGRRVASGLAQTLAGLARLTLIELHADPAALEKVRPTPADIAALFHPDVAAEAAAAYATIWAEARPPRGSGTLEVHAAPAGLFRSNNPLSAPFPGGYRSIAPWLTPQRAWVCWSWGTPGTTGGTRWDGLAWVEPRWVWCPRPHRVLRGLPADRFPDLAGV